MIDPQSADRAGADKIDKQLVSRLKDFPFLLANRREMVHIKEATIIDFFRRDAPEREAVSLRVQQFVERVEAPRITWAAVNFFHRAFDRLLHRWRFLTTA